MLVLIGATPEGKKELVGFRSGAGECPELAGTAGGCEAAGAQPRARDRSG